MKTIRFALLLAAALSAPLARAADKAPARARTVELAVTDSGLAPAEVQVKKGEPLHLGITRNTDRTCMTEVVIEGAGVRRALPLHKTVYADFTPEKSGSIRILCGMGMAFGKLLVN